MKKYIAFILASLFLLASGTFAGAEHDRTIALDAEEYIVYIGKQQKLTATVTANTDSAPKKTNIVWTSSDPAIAAVNNGTVSGKKAGTVTVTAAAKDDPAIFASAVVEVRVPVQKISINEKNLKLLVGADESAARAQLTCTVTPEDAYVKTGVWTSTKEDIVTVDAQGNIRALKAGTAAIVFTSDDPNGTKKAQVNVKVDQAVTSVAFDAEAFSLPTGRTRQIKAVLEPANAADKKLVWTSSDASVARVNAAGQVQGVSAGTAVITAAAHDGSGVMASCAVTVVQSVKKLALQDKKIDLAPGTYWVQTYTVEPETATVKDVVWTSSNEEVATVDGNGVITGVAPGACRIVGTAADGSGIKAQADVKVQNYDVVIASPEGVHVDFDTQRSESRAGIQINNRFWGDFYETNVVFKTGCAAGASGNMLTPVKAGADSVTITEKHNNKKIRNETHTIYVAQSALGIEAPGYGVD